MSGRPIYPIAMATSRRFELRNWDRTTVNLPFARGATVVPEPIRVAADADEAALEAARLRAGGPAWPPPPRAPMSSSTESDRG